MANRFRPDIEGLRGIAVLQVILFHIGFRWYRSGLVGVDVFFVLSGYLITGLLVEESERSGTIDLLRFYARRARRLLPAAAAVLVATLVVGALIFSPAEDALYSRTARAVAVYASNIWFLRNSGDYFTALRVSNPFLHTWSLAVEEQFYIVWPCAILAWSRLTTSRLRLGLFLVVLGIGSFGLSLAWTATTPGWAFFSAPTRVWEFALGGIAWLTPPRWLRPGRRVDFAGLAGLAGVVLSGMWRGGDTNPAGFTILAAAAGTAALLAANADAGARVGPRLLSLPPLRFLGRISYSLYLWHWPLLVFAAAFTPDPPLLTKVAACAIALILATLSYRYIESPVRHNSVLGAMPGPVLAGAVGISMFAIGAGFLSERLAKHAGTAAGQRPFVAAAQDFSTPRSCMTDFGDSRVVTCIYGDSLSRITVAVFGDSHATQWIPSLDLVGRQRGWRIVQLSKSGCPSVGVRVANHTQGNSEERACAGWRSAAFDRIAEIRPSFVFITNAQVYARPATQKLSYNDWEQGTRALLVSLDSIGIASVLVRDTPQMSVDIPDCLARMQRQGRLGAAICTQARTVALDATIFDAERHASSGMKRNRMIDLTDAFCGALECSPIRSGLIVYRDTDHITATYARSIAPVLAARLQ